MKHIRNIAAALGALSLVALATGTTVGATTEPPSEGGELLAGFILPDSASSVRWESFDRPLIEAACAEAGIECVIQNAEGDVDNMSTIADQMITQGVGVLAIVNLDSESGAAIQERAAAAGVRNIDYDRLTLGGSADVYVSFDNVAVGTAQGEGMAPPPTTTPPCSGRATRRPSLTRVSRPSARRPCRTGTTPRPR